MTDTGKKLTAGLATVAALGISAYLIVQPKPKKPAVLTWNLPATALATNLIVVIDYLDKLTVTNIWKPYTNLPYRAGSNSLVIPESLTNKAMFFRIGYADQHIKR